jgi:hypothetical protein
VKLPDRTPAEFMLQVGAAANKTPLPEGPELVKTPEQASAAAYPEPDIETPVPPAPAAGVSTNVEVTWNCAVVESLSEPVKLMV